jgi:hypothetical protein
MLVRDFAVQRPRNIRCWNISIVAMILVAATLMGCGLIAVAVLQWVAKWPAL